ncbi:ribonuclease P protein component [Acidaminobacter sp. JC074]|uniref:ribonuclease P protein component n=1 Tax=Acidaminobacter sp. JC074 TaxID=2530199 RepID=UPI001F0D176F|nr:ribonuclease P protein component [Acidaminobacter sp. JC074]MCH4891231.1 ribonuclease P protein component [Acidaminobacter sp. JC074]
MTFDTLRNTRQFNQVYKKGKSIVNRHVVMYYRKNQLGYNQVGFSVSKKVGKAVVRNRVKRLMKESFRMNHEKLAEGYDFVFVARVRSKDSTYQEIDKAMKHCFRKGKLMR